jgi:hypothetical protein
MGLEELRIEAEKFFEWPGDTKDHVTLTSALLFAKLMMKKERDSLARASPCERICQQVAYNAEIKRLRKAMQQTIEENPHLADGDDCTLIKLKIAIQYP